MCCDDQARRRQSGVVNHPQRGLTDASIAERERAITDNRPGGHGGPGAHQEAINPEGTTFTGQTVDVAVDFTVDGPSRRRRRPVHRYQRQYKRS